MTMNVRIEGLRVQLNNARRILADIPDDKLTAVTPVEGYGTIGEQFRHLINYVQVLLRDFEKGVFNFNDRERDSALEADKIAIDMALADLHDRVGEFLDKDPDISLRSVFIPVTHKPSVEDGKTLGDAVNYVSDHSYHHTAAIKLLAYIQGVEIQSDAGVAPATEVHRKYQAG